MDSSVIEIAGLKLLAVNRVIAPLLLPLRLCFFGGGAEEILFFFSFRQIILFRMPLFHCHLPSIPLGDDIKVRGPARGLMPGGGDIFMTSGRRGE